MERFDSPENKEVAIDRLIEKFAADEGMKLMDVQSDIIAFAEIVVVDIDAIAYFEEMAEKIGISLAELMQYAKQKLNAK